MYSSKNSPLFIDNDGYAPICYDCVNRLLFDLQAEYKDFKIALMIVCHYLDLYFSETLYEQNKYNPNFGFGDYRRMLNVQGRNKTFIDTILELSKEGLKGAREIQRDMEDRWSLKDKQNMTYVISTIGYDPFDDCEMSDADRKFCFNVLAGYCDDEDISEDGHKIQSVIQLTKLHLQCNKIDQIINQELLSPKPDDTKINSFSGSKKKLLDSITKIAQDNNISSRYNKAVKQGRNTATFKMKQIEKDGFNEIKVNLFDIETAKAMRQIADLSNQSIMEQLTLDSNEYSEMVKEQREMIVKLQDQCDKSKEEIRLLKNKIRQYERKNK